MRLIDADSLVALVNDTTILTERFKEMFISIVNGEPSVQPEIIHCKECKHHISYKVIPSDWCIVECDAFDSSMARQIKPDFFCGYAERREDETDRR